MCEPISPDRLAASEQIFTNYLVSNGITVADPLFELLHVTVLGTGDLREFAIEWMKRNTHAGIVT